MCDIGNHKSNFHFSSGRTDTATCSCPHPRRWWRKRGVPSEDTKLGSGDCGSSGDCDPLGTRDLCRQQFISSHPLRRTLGLLRAACAAPDGSQQAGEGVLDLLGVQEACTA